MQLLLTDSLTCPRCGPSFGLILLANDLADRRVYDGVLGCPNCRDSFSVAEGFADLRAPPRGELPAGLAGDRPVDDGDEDATRVIALLGILGGAGTVAMVGRAARFAQALAARVGELAVVAVDPDARGWLDHPRVSRIASRPGLPFATRALRGVVVDGDMGKVLLGEAARVVAPRSRVVVLEPATGTAEILEEAGLSVLAQDDRTIVAART